MRLLVGLGLFVGLWINTVWATEADNTVQSVGTSWNIYGNVELLNMHVWRGGKSGNAPSLEPMMEISWNKLTLGSWAAATFDGQFKELDLYLAYSLGNFTLGVYDYYCPPFEAVNPEFVNFQGPNTFHLYSVDASFNGTDDFPVKLTASTMMYGMDRDPESGNNYFSTYLEAKFYQDWNQWEFSSLLGATPHKGIYASQAAFMNVEFEVRRNFTMKHWKLPVFTRLTYNPYSQQLYFIGGISLKANYSW